MDHDRKAKYILAEEPTLFLHRLDIMDERGRVYDKRRAKFRQINRFLEMVRDALEKVDDLSRLCVYDLCCGKAYLTFAVYHYLVNIRGLHAAVYGVDLKKDVIAKCAAIAEECGFDGLHFGCGSIEEIKPDQRVDVVLALHACDTATDVALANAVKWNAKIILCAPCCQHELSNQIKPDALGQFLKQPLIRYRFAQLATDALRCQILEICGYHVQAVEFIDPDETDKNLMIKAIRKNGPLPAARRKALLDDYLQKTALLGVSPTIATLLQDRIFR